MEIYSGIEEQMKTFAVYWKVVYKEKEDCQKSYNGYGEKEPEVKKVIFLTSDTRKVRIKEHQNHWKKVQNLQV